MSDTSDNQVLKQSIESPDFQTRVYLRFVNAAISVTTELSTVTSHTQRLAFAGSLFAKNVPLDMLASVVIANATIRTEVLANPQQAGGNAIDSDIDFQVNSVFTGIAVSRTWT